jgi:hypothetical protein
MDRYTRIQQTVESGGDTVVEVHFRKKDGHLRVILTIPTAGARHVLGPLAPSGKARGAELRHELHPEYLNVWDVEAKDWRTVNMDTTEYIKVGDKEYTDVASW